MRKYNGEFFFPTALDMAPFVEGVGAAVYTLHSCGCARGVSDGCSVVVHEGDVDDGHFYTLVKPAQGRGWLKFDDEAVAVGGPEELAIAFGGSGTASACRILEGGVTSADMLFYVRDDVPVVKFGAEDVPVRQRWGLDADGTQAEVLGAIERGRASQTNGDAASAPPFGSSSC